MTIEIVNRNEEGFEYYVLIPTIEVVNEWREGVMCFDIPETIKEGYWEKSVGISFMNLSIWIVWI